ncbi:MAG TPA: UvrD-helicase domain-containing protein [Acetobacteraceae bacterium]|nr:UvrD-helicase domain-containing protein [Acetobacteraceae bacterium]
MAGAGSGKTNTLAHRAAHMVVNGTDPRRILSDDVLPPGRRRDDPACRVNVRSRR